MRITRNLSENDLHSPNLLIENQKIKQREQKLNLVTREKQIAKEIIEENNGWNNELEVIVANIGEKAAGFKWMHRRAASYYNKLFQWLGIISILIQAGAGTGAVTQISTCPGPNTSNWVIILVGILMYITAVVTSIQQFKNWSSRSENHKQAHSNYGALEHNIRIMLGIYRRDRQVGKDYAEWISKEFDDLTASTPQIPGPIQKKYNQLVESMYHDGGGKLANDNFIEKIQIKNYSKKGSPPPTILAENTLLTVPSTERRKSHTEVEIAPEIDVPKDTAVNNSVNSVNSVNDVVIDIESPFENTRYQYEVKRFLNNQSIKEK
jgi:hypothetical protein